jgi:3-hydroxyacyl-CoA dehydrogenase
METAIRKVCVIGAGTMGAGIAAQVANAGLPVLLLDIPAKDGDDRSAISKAAVARMLKTEPAPFMGSRQARLVETGNTEDDLARVSECDWIIEAVVERLDIKQSLYAKLESVRRPGTAVSSNTSTIPLQKLVEGRSDAFRRDFLITHFFNPPRYMRLIEIATGDDTDASLAAAVTDFIDRQLGKTVVRVRDTPGFIANRIGTFWLTTAVHAAMSHGLRVEEADQIAGKPMGVPATGVFGLIDLVGVDLMPLLAKSLGATLPPDDPLVHAMRPVPLIERMIADGYTGRKGKGGFYKLEKAADGSRTKLALDLSAGTYRPSGKPDALPSEAERNLSALCDLPGAQGAFARDVLHGLLAYSASLLGEIAGSVVAVDDAMKLGYNWRWGPFELIDRFGPARLARALEAEGRPVPPVLAAIGEGSFYRQSAGTYEALDSEGRYHPVVRAEGVLLLADIKRSSQPVLKNESAAVWDAGDGVLVFEFTSKMNSLDHAIMALLSETIARVQASHRALVIYNDGDNFSAGANLAAVVEAIDSGSWESLESVIAEGQRVYQALKYAPFPVVAAPAGLALGGGCEICLHADAIQAHAETYIGLVEVGVGVIPGWGGCGEMIDRLSKVPAMPKGPMPAVMKAFELISTAQVAKSAAEARDMTILRPTDGITMNRERVLADAKARALSMVSGYVPPAPPVFRLPGASGRAAFADAVKGFQARGLATEYDGVIAGRLAYVLTGGDADPVDLVTEDQVRELERRMFMDCVRDPRTRDRIVTMLKTGKPLRN